MPDSNLNAGRLLAMLHNMPRETTGTLRNAPNDRDYVGLGLTTDEFVAARDVLIEAKQIEVNGDSWKLMDLKAVPQGYTPGFDAIPPVHLPEALPRSIEQVAAGAEPDLRGDPGIGGHGYSGPAKPVPVQAEPETETVGLATDGVRPVTERPPAEPAKAEKVNEATARPGETGVDDAPQGEQPVGEATEETQAASTGRRRKAAADAG
jgi:hypothetical protein